MFHVIILRNRKGAIMLKILVVFFNTFFQPITSMFGQGLLLLSPFTMI